MTRLPALFVGHGSPMNAIEDSEFRRRWQELGRTLPRPDAILCVSAHWETRGVFLTGAATPPTIHDFYGFPQPLFDVRYPAPGQPALARRVASILGGFGALVDPERGLDHGCWSVLVAMYPQADVPVVQLSLDSRQRGAFHYALAKELRPLRDSGVLILGSGNIVHNLRLADFRLDTGYDWAVRFDAELRARIEAGDHATLADYHELGPDARLSIPTPEHYLPLLYALGLQQAGDEVRIFNRTGRARLDLDDLGVGRIRRRALRRPQRPRAWMRLWRGSRRPARRTLRGKEPTMIAKKLGLVACLVLCASAAAAREPSRLHPRAPVVGRRRARGRAR